jgi:hypothetical protein
LESEQEPQRRHSEFTPKEQPCDCVFQEATALTQFACGAAAAQSGGYRSWATHTRNQTLQEALDGRSDELRSGVFRALMLEELSSLPAMLGR